MSKEKVRKERGSAFVTKGDGKEEKEHGRKVKSDQPLIIVI